MKTYFLATSYGRTATLWLASLLNSHTDIICNHGPSVSDASVDYNEKSIPDYHTIEIHNLKDSFYTLSVDDLFDFLETKGEAKAYGNVHGYAAQSIFPLENKVSRKIKVINILRHPVTRIESQKNRLVYEFKFNEHLKNEFNNDYENMVPYELTEYIGDKYGISFDSDEDKFYIYSLCLIAKMDWADIQTPYIHVPMERLTKDTEYFCWIFRYITDGIIPLSADFIGRIHLSDRKNELSSGKSGFEQYKLWPEWMKNAFDIMCERYDFTTLYSSLNYDFSFSNKPESKIISLLKENSEIFKAKDEKPTLWVEGYCGYNIVKFKNKFFGISQSIGPFDLDNSIEQKAMEKEFWDKIIIGDSLKGIKETIKVVN